MVSILVKIKSRYLFVPVAEVACSCRDYVQESNLGIHPGHAYESCKADRIEIKHDHPWFITSSIAGGKKVPDVTYKCCDLFWHGPKLGGTVQLFFFRLRYCTSHTSDDDVEHLCITWFGCIYPSLSMKDGAYGFTSSARFYDKTDDEIEPRRRRALVLYVLKIQDSFSSSAQY